MYYPWFCQQVRDSLGVYCISVVVAYILHLAVEAPVIAIDAFVFKGRTRKGDRDGKSGQTEQQHGQSDTAKSIALNPFDLKLIYKL